MQRRVLTVEDSFEVRIALEMALLQEGYEVRACADAESAWEDFARFDPDLALLDIRLPGLSGIQLCRLIREGSKIPVIMFSAVEEQAEKIEAFKSGADDYVVKGAGIDELLIRVASQLRWQREASNVDQEPDNGKGSLWHELNGHDRLP